MLSQVCHHFSLHIMISLEELDAHCFLRGLFLSIHIPANPLRCQMAPAGTKPPFLSCVLYLVTWAPNNTPGAQSHKDISKNNFFTSFLLSPGLQGLGKSVHGVHKSNRYPNSISYPFLRHMSGTLLNALYVFAVLILSFYNSVKLVLIISILHMRQQAQKD